MPEKRIIPAEVTLQKTLTKIAKYCIIFWIVPAKGKEPPIVNIRYRGFLATETSNIRRKLKSATKPPASLRWVETHPRKYGSWWYTKCNGVKIELGSWGSETQDKLLLRTTRQHLAGVEMAALPQNVLQEILVRSPGLKKDFPGIRALEADPIPLIWTNLLWK